MNTMLALPSNSRQIFISIAVSFICFLHIPYTIANKEFKLFHSCYPMKTETYTSGSQFQSNLNRLLKSLVTTAAQDGYFNASLGKNPDIAYGLAQCRDDLSRDVCHRCLNTAALEIIRLCPKEKNAVLRYDRCILRYSNENFFSVAISGSAVQLSPKTISDSDALRFFQQLSVLFNSLSRNASLSKTRYSYGDISYAPFKTIHGAVQCTRDLSPENCKYCLGVMISTISNCCNTSARTVIYSVSCYLRYDNNTFIEAAPKRNGNVSTNIALIILPIIGSVVLLSVCVSVLARRIWKRSQKALPETISDHDGIRSEASSDHSGIRNDTSCQSDLNRAGIKSDVSPQFDLNVIRAATNGFSDTNRLGEGGFGTVYKGKLFDGQEIAVKRLSLKSEQGLHEFKNEVDFLLKLQHRNLVSLLGYCVEKNEKLLIYEFVSNTSLDNYIFDSRKKSSLDWKMRVKIIGGIARGLLYLHEDSKLTIIHRDLKAGNILLDEKMNAKIADFGLARLFGLDQIQDTTCKIVGTLGHIAPEYAIDGIFSVKSDVFSFGILLLEIVSGRNASRFNHTSSPSDLQAYAWNLWDKRDNKKLMDSAISHSYSSEVKRYIHIGLLCVQHNVEDRPTMSSVIEMFNNNNITLERPTVPTSLMKSRYAAADTESDDQSLL